ncbi:MAG: carbohydrate-binding domain-containing protein [Prevotella sp.]|nr:carbohydrate-binding domain-containing protein [Prevotella sp.]
MKKIMMILLAAVGVLTASAQTLNVHVGNVTYQFPAAQAGEMTYAEGTTLTIMGKAFNISDINSISIDFSTVTDNAVTVAYEGSAAQVTVAGNVAKYLTPVVSGAHVSIAQSEELTNELIEAGTASEITYTLSGTSSDGEFYMSGASKATVELNGLTLTNQTPVYSGAAVHIQDGKRIKVKVVTGTTNTLVDAASGAQKGCLYIKGHGEFAQKGTLNVVGNVKHAIKTGEYFTLKNATVNVTSAVGDGINCGQYFLMQSGTVNISGTSDDGIQCDIDDTETYPTGTGEILADESAGIEAHDDEDSGNIYIEGGTFNISVTADAAKAIKSEGDFRITGGTLTCTTSGGGIWDTSKLKTKAAACLSADGNMTITGGTLTLTSTGDGGKGIGVDGTLTISNDANITVTTKGNAVVASSSGVLSVVTSSSQLDRYTTSYKSSPKGIKADGAITISGGITSVTTNGAGGEGIESKEEITISGGQVIVNASDDAINAAYKKDDSDKWVSGSGNMTVTGGYVFARSTNNDGMDSNGNTYIKGGLVYAIGAAGAEMAIDANTEEQKKLYIQGGTIIAVGKLENGASISGGTCKQTTSWTGNTWYALYDGSTLVAAFQTPAKSGSSGGYGPGGGSQSLIVYTSSTPALKTGSTNNPMTVTGGTEYFDGMANFGCTVSGGGSVTLSNYSSSSGGRF